MTAYIHETRAQLKETCFAEWCLLQGEHPEHKGVMDPKQLAIVERYFVEVMDIPCLQALVECFLFHRQFTSNAQRVSSSTWPNMLCGPDACVESVG